MAPLPSKKKLPAFYLLPVCFSVFVVFKIELVGFTIANVAIYFCIFTADDTTSQTSIGGSPFLYIVSAIIGGVGVEAITLIVIFAIRKKTKRRDDKMVTKKLSKYRLLDNEYVS